MPAGPTDADLCKSRVGKPKVGPTSFEEMPIDRCNWRVRLSPVPLERNTEPDHRPNLPLGPGCSC